MYGVCVCVWYMCVRMCLCVSEQTGHCQEDKAGGKLIWTASVEEIVFRI